MKKIVSLLFLSVTVLSFSVVRAQCNLRPVIKPDNLILCPDSFDTLYTTEEYDTYQWFRFNKPIPGATQRYLVVNYFEDASTFFKVKVTKGNCTDTSKKVLVDGYAFAGPVVITTGTPSYIDPQTGSSVFCKNEPVSLIFPAPYTQNIQWYNNGKPIPGADSSVYVVTGSGSYTVCGAPAVCPAFTQCQGVPVVIGIDKSIPSIRQTGDTLIASPGKSYQWNLNNNPLPGAASQYYMPLKKGFYTVTVTDKFNCTATSKPVLFTASKNIIVIAPNPVRNIATVRLFTDEAVLLVVADIYGNHRKQIPVNSNVQRINVEQLPLGTYIVHALDKQGNEIGSTKLMKSE